MTTLAAAILTPLARPLVSLIFERQVRQVLQRFVHTLIMIGDWMSLTRPCLWSQAFDARARELVAAMFSVYITGGFTYVARDLVVRVFYTIGNTS